MPLDQWLEKTDAEAESNSTDLDRWLAGDGEQQQLETSARLGQAKDPERTARVYEQQGKTGLPRELIERNLEEVEKQSQAQDFDAAAFRKESPMVAKWLAEQPDHVALAFEDRSHLGYLERQLRHISQQNEQGQATEELSRLGEQAMAGTITPEGRTRAKALQEKMRFQADYGIDGFFEGIPGAVANQLPILARTLSAGIQGAGTAMPAGAAVGAGTAAVAGQLGPQAALPEELVTVPAGAATGAVIGGIGGWRVGAGVDAGRMEAGLAYLEYEGLTAEDGTPLSRETALGAATAVGVINGALEVAGLESIFKNAPVLRGFTRKGMKRLLQQPSVRDALGRYAGGIGQAMLVEGGTEFLQEMVTHAAGELAVMVESGDIRQMSAGDVVERLFGGVDEAIAAGRMGMQAGGGISTAVSSPAMVADIRQARQAQKNADLFTAIGESVQQSELSRRLPEKLQELVGKITSEGNGDTVYMDRSLWDTYWQSLGEDPRAVAEEVMGDASTYDQASTSDVELAFPTGAYAARIAGTEHHAALVRDIHFDPMGMSAREADAYLESLDNDAANASNTQQAAGEQIRQDVLGQLLATGTERGAAEAQAEAMASVFRTLGERSGQDPEALYRKYGLRVTRPLPENLAQVSQTDQMDVLLDRLRSADVPSQRDAFGESLMEFVRARGLTDEGGELAARDVDVTRAPFQRRIVRDDGDTLDGMAEAAQEAGFIVNRDPDALLEALDRELAGEPVFAPSAQDSQALSMREALEELADYLDQAGIDIEQTDNATIKELLAGAPPIDTQEAAGMVLDQFVGERARTANRMALEFAQARVRNGADPEAVRQESGWFQGVDGRWRFEISDDQAALKPHALENLSRGTLDAQTVVTLDYRQNDDGTWMIQMVPESARVPDDIALLDGISDTVLESLLPADKVAAMRRGEGSENLMFPDRETEVESRIIQEPFYFEGFNALPLDHVLDHPRLFAAYPQLSRVMVQVNPQAGNGGSLGLSDNGQQVITVGSRDQLSTMLHEIQHTIQREEGFARGGSPSEFESAGINDPFLQRIMDAVRDVQRMSEDFGLALDEVLESGVIDPDISENLRSVLSLDNWTQVLEQAQQEQLTPFEQYQRLAGEIEARNTQTRQEMSDEERALLPPELTADIPADQAIVIMNGEALAAAPANAEQESQLDQTEETASSDQQQTRFDQAERIIRRGSIRFGTNRQFNIELYKDANLSTFLHESGHFFLEVMGDLAQSPDAPAQIRDDYKAILDWFGVESRDAIGVEHHEQWARGFEAYLMEGKAPNAALRQIFSRFRAWLLAIYRRMSALNVELSDEVRGVMDRLMATDAEIEAAQLETSMQPLFEAAEAAGMTEAEFADYQAAVETARLQAEEDIARQAMTEIQREERAWWKEARAQVRSEVAEEVHGQKEYVAAAVLGRGKLPNGEPLPEGMPALKLNRKALQEQYGSAFMKRLPRPYVYSAKGGVHPDVAADLLGFDTGEQLVHGLADLRPMNQLIEAETDVRMRERYGDIRTDGTAAQKAVEAVHNEGRAELLLREITNLASRTRRRIAPLDLVRHRAQRTIAEKRVRDLRPDLYLRAERKAAREAFEAAARQDFSGAFNAKQRQLLNHELYREATRARDGMEKARRYFGKFERKATRKRLAKAGEGYLDQIDALLERFEFKRIPNRQLDRRQALARFISEHEAEGLPVQISDKLADEAFTTNYRELTVEELQGLEDAVRNIDHLASLKSRLVSRAESRDMDAAVDEMVSEAERFHDTTPEPIEFAPGLGKRFLDKVKHAAAAHTKLEFLFEWMDGNQAQGAFWRHLFQPIAEAELTEQRMLREVSENMRRIFSAYEKGAKAEAFFRREHIPQVGHLTRAQMLVVGLNWGNQYNREALMEGYGWSEGQIHQILARLTAKDWNTIQQVWDYIDSFWPQIAQLERDLTGLAPEKVRPAAVITEHGEFRGGYYPIIFDAKLSWRQSLLDEKEQATNLYGGSWARAMTKHGHTKERTNTGGKPIKLEISGLGEHLTNVVHDLSYRRAIIDVDRLSRRPEIRRTIEAVAGRDYYRQINPWLNAIARDRRELANPLESVLAYARTGATVVNMGWKATTALVQPLGYTVSVKELGLRYSLKGLRSVYGPNAYKSFREAWEFVTERSTMMGERTRNYDRDVRDTMKRLNLEGDSRMVALRSSFFIHIGYMDMSISLPTWMGAYQKAMDGGVDNLKPGDEQAAISYADRTVRVTQSAGAAKDLSLVQSGSETFRLFTMFYSYFSVLFNQFQKSSNQFRLTGNVPELFSAMVMLWFMPAVLENIMRNAFSDEEPEERLADIAFDTATYPFQSVVLLRDVVSGMGEYGYDGSAALDAMESLSRVGRITAEQTQDLLTGEDNNEWTRADTRALVLATGYSFRLPARQAWTTAEYLHDWITGETQPESPMEGLWRTLVSGKPKDER